MMDLINRYFLLQFHYLLPADPVRASRGIPGPPSEGCLIIVHGLVAEEFEYWNLYRQVLVHVSSAGDGIGWPVQFPANDNRDRDHGLVSHHTGRCGRDPGTDTVHELFGVLQCSGAGGASPDQAAIVGFHVPRISGARPRIHAYSGKSGGRVIRVLRGSGSVFVAVAAGDDPDVLRCVSWSWAVNCDRQTHTRQSMREGRGSRDSKRVEENFNCFG